MNLSLLNNAGASGGDSRDQSTVQKHPLGTVAVGGDGSQYRYVKAGAGAALVAGNCIQGPGVVTTHLGMVPVAAPIGATSVTFTLGASNAVTANQYSEGWLQLDTTPGNGRRYRIAGHPAALAAASLTVTLYPDDAVSEVAISTATRVGLIPSPYNGCIQMPVTTATGMLVGVATTNLPASQFGWVQTKGFGTPLIAGTPALGGMVISPSAAPGAAEVSTGTTILTGQIVGRMVQIGAAGKNNGVILDID
jgi:hypothetical protein